MWPDFLMWLSFWWVACRLMFNSEGRCLNLTRTVMFQSSRCCWDVQRQQQLVMSWWKWKRNISTFFSKSPGNDMEPWGSIASIYPRAIAPLHLTRLQKSAQGKQQHYYGQNCDQINWEKSNFILLPSPLYLGNGRGSTLEQGSGWNPKGELKWAMALLSAHIFMTFNDICTAVCLLPKPPPLCKLRLLNQETGESKVLLWKCSGNISVYCKQMVYQCFLSKSGRPWSLLSKLNLPTIG